MTRTKPAGQRRSELLDAAEALVRRDGADAFTVDDVTSGAGVAKGTFYLHFANKTELLHALRDRFVRRFADAQLAAAGQASGAERVERWMRTGVAEYLRELRLHDVLFHPAGGVERDAPNVAVDALAGLLAELDPPVADPTVTAVILYSAMHGATDHIVHRPEDEQRVLDGLTRLCRALVPAS
ncbi:TetR/AcrR family transcriptional regulator [Prauserella flavalba]|uniref:TetR/AcrR family transcriptional regulator n=1 Tax=Prauserella flavalba TaxID=1477506 RepID=UPI001AEF5C7D|nr:TetR/AcrR family transcriptional regulator [Prauserella flavalba]